MNANANCIAGKYDASSSSFSRPPAAPFLHRAVARYAPPTSCHDTVEWRWTYTNAFLPLYLTLYLSQLFSAATTGSASNSATLPRWAYIRSASWTQMFD
ncbi:hypothetical protein GGX14DRAFT_553678 [Mycena pura]|uniref:Uncharacterized protein n=1 Tax=Mycena pura TaxID=153505 RepID=A0AAD7E6E1_9AGAR|nr:hypothetical protein GGX14DRAFT_553678 [Mycena pura]